MSLQTRLEAVVAAIGADIKSLRAGLFAGNVTGQTGVYDGSNRVYSDSNPPETLVRTLTSATPATPGANLVVETVRGKRIFLKHSDGTETEISGSVQQYAETLGAGTTHTVTHNLGTRDVTVQFYGLADPWETQWATIRRPSVNTITCLFGTAITAGTVRVVVQGKAD